MRHVCNFVLGEHSDYCLYYFVIEHYKGTTIFANHQIYRQLYFIELTLNYIANLRKVQHLWGIFISITDYFVPTVCQLLYYCLKEFTYIIHLLMTEQELQELLGRLEEAGWDSQVCDTPIPFYDNQVMCGGPTDVGDIVPEEYSRRGLADNKMDLFVSEA